MKVLIQGKQLQLSEELKAYAQSRMVEPLVRLFDDPATELRIELGETNGAKRGTDKECHATLRMAGLGTIQITEATADPYASVDAAAARLLRAAKRELDRIRRKSRHPHKLTAVAKDGAPSPPLAAWATRKVRGSVSPRARELETGEELSGRTLSVAEAERLGETNEA